MIRVAPEGRPFIAGAWSVAAALLVVGWWIPLAFWLPIAVWVVAFFRDPARDAPRGDDLVLAPADGRVLSIIPMYEAEFLQGSATRISIFMNVFNVHVNRYPASGVVRYRRYVAGRFFHAAADKAATENEQSTIGIETPRGRILVRQIAGLIARRIVTDHGEGAAVEQGSRLGLIRFGSRVDVFLPPQATPAVAVGDPTRAGETVLARWS